MARVFTFTVPDGAHTWYEDASTGAIVPAVNGTAVAAHLVLRVDDYVAAGLGTISGTDTDAARIYYETVDGLRKVLIDINQPLPGPPESWTLASMLAKCSEIYDADQAAKDNWGGLG